MTIRSQTCWRVLSCANKLLKRISSLTLTLNYKPVANLKIQPEIRFDHTSFKGGLDGKKDRVIVGVGVTYLF